MKKKLEIMYQVSMMMLIVTVFVYRDLVGYGLGQLKGQLNIVNRAISIEQALSTDELPDSIKVRLRQVREIKRFAIDEIGLNENGNYETVVIQHGKADLWVVTASKPFQLEDYTWHFPLLGEVGYKGFFDYSEAIKEGEELKGNGFDVGIREVTAWSTLGFFDDPVLTNFLNRSEGELASLIIHEMTHGTLFVRDSLLFNENLANFVGDYGSMKYMQDKYGVDAPEVSSYQNAVDDRKKYIAHILEGADRLDSLYKAMGIDESDEEKRRKKAALISEIMTGLENIDFSVPQKYHRNYSNEELPNNTFFQSMRRYNARQNNFQLEFEQDFDADFKTYFRELEKRYKSI